jgi:hypothetical protein
MSYVTEIIRPLTKSELQAVVAEDAELAVLTEGETSMEVGWSGGERRPLLFLAQGRLTLTSPDDAAWAKAQEIARKLGAIVIGEEDDLPVRAPAQGSASVRSGWVGWPVLVVVLVALLIWKW